MRRLLIVGDQRSGTTLVAELVGALEGAAIHAGMFTRCFDVAHDLGLTPDQPIDARLSELLIGALRWNWPTTTGSSWPRALDRPHPSLNGLHGRALAACSGGTTLVAGHKEHGPFSMLLPWLDTTDVHVLVVVRDARDVMLSRWWRGDPMLDLRLAEWREHARLVTHLGPHPRLRVVRFEDVVRRPVPTMAALARWLDLRAVEHLDELRAGRSVWTQNSSLGEPLALCDPSAVERWRARSNEPLCRYATTVCRRELRALGYDASAAVSTREAFGYWRRWLTAASVKLAARARRTAATRLLPPL